jgi:hypothetical protein
VRLSAALGVKRAWVRIPPSATLLASLTTGAGDVPWYRIDGTTV